MNEYNAFNKDERLVLWGGFEQWIKDNKTRGIKECKEIKSMTTKN